MTFTGDERGQPVVIGALLIFTILILVFSGYQAFAVPNQNAEVEFNHFQDVQSDFAEFETSLINAVESGDTRSASINLGPQYPSRMLALNPPPAAGSLQTTESGEVSVTESGSPVNVCRDGGTATSRSLVYQPGYAEFDNAESIVYENRVTGRQFREGNVFAEQRLVESASGNDRINLLLLTGEVSENGVGVSNIEVNATSRYSTTVSNPNITL
ncbi:MAG: PKD domain-containing protein, partial [Natronomonas sp.]